MNETGMPAAQRLEGDGSAFSMKFLFVHSWNGFCLAQWYLHDALTRFFNGNVEFHSIRVDAAGTPANDVLQRALLFLWPEVIGFSCHYWDIDYFLKCAEEAKFFLPQTHVVFGGPQVSSVASAEFILSENRQVDSIIRGRGEGPLCSLLETILLRKSLVKVPSLSWRGSRGIDHNPVVAGSPRQWTIFADGKIDASGLWRAREIAYETACGCRNACSYCVYPQTPPSLLPDDIVFEELQFLLKMQPGCLRFCDAHFGGAAERAKRILRWLRTANIVSKLLIYPELSSIDEEYLRLISESGAVITSIGIQSTDREVLRTINRKNALTHADRIALVLEAFPDVPADIILGLPGDDGGAFLQTCRDVLNLGFRFVNINVLKVLPGSALHGRKKEFGIVTASDGQFMTSGLFPIAGRRRAAVWACAMEVACKCTHMRRYFSEHGGKQDAVLDCIVDFRPEVLFRMYQTLNPLNAPAGTLAPEALQRLVSSLPAMAEELKNACVRDLEAIFSGNRNQPPPP